MFVTTPHLASQGPSPTTVQYTVSNAPLRRSVAGRAVFGLSLLLRGAAVVLALLFLAVKYSCPDGDRSCAAAAGGSPSPLVAAGALLFDGAALAQPWELAVPLCLAALYLCFRRYHTEESLLIIRTLGIQTSTSSRSYLGTATTRFIPTSHIQDIFIHEAFIGFEVRYYLAIVVEGESELTVVFPNLLPKLAIVEEVWRGARACLFESRPKGVRNPR